MPYLMRFVTTEESRLSLEYLDRGLRKHHKIDTLHITPDSPTPTAIFYNANQKLALIRIRTQDDPEFQKTLAHMREQLSTYTLVPEEVSSLVANAQAMVVVEVLASDREAEETQDLLEPIWALFFEFWDGLMFLEEDGWHDAFGLIFRVKERDYEFF